MPSNLYSPFTRYSPYGGGLAFKPKRACLEKDERFVVMHVLLKDEVCHHIEAASSLNTAQKQAIWVHPSLVLPQRAQVDYYRAVGHISAMGSRRNLKPRD
jgi:hypothetical protein